MNRSCHASSADPAAEEFQYPVSFDIRDLVTLEDVLEECALGPNGYDLAIRILTKPMDHGQP